MGRLWHLIQHRLNDFVEDWIYPAYSLRNCFIHRYDIVRMPRLGRTAYHEPCERMYHANMELVRQFVEKQDWERFAWYDERDGNGDVEREGIRYGMNPDVRVYLPEYKGKYVMDMIKEVYEWQVRGLPELERDYSYVLSLEAGLFPASRDENLDAKALERAHVRWDILDKYLNDNRKNLLDRKFVAGIGDRIVQKMERGKQRCLHLCIEVRPYLWT